MEERTSVKCILKDNAGRPVKDAVVLITEGSHEFNDIAAVTDDSGIFYLSNIVVPGTYVLQIKGNSKSERKKMNVQSKKTIQITF